MSTLLQADKVSVSFGGLTALSDVSFAVEQGEIFSIIGPNGAGKTTLFNVISGLYTPSAGSIALNGRTVTGLSPVELAAAGMRRTFQNLQLTPGMTVLDNVLVGAHLQFPGGLLAGAMHTAALRDAETRIRAKARDILEFVGLSGTDNALAGALSYGAMRRVELARALIGDPLLVLLDEPAAGLNNAETLEMSALIGKIAKSGITIALVEHDMGLVMSISDRILVLNYGCMLTTDTPDAVRNNPAVIAAYLGEDEEEAAA